MLPINHFLSFAVTGKPSPEVLGQSMQIKQTIFFITRTLFLNIFLVPVYYHCLLSTIYYRCVVIAQYQAYVFGCTLVLMVGITFFILFFKVILSIIKQNSMFSAYSEVLQK